MSSTGQSHYRVRSAADEGPRRLGLDVLAEWCASLLLASGLSQADADLVAASLVDAEARGISSHGVARVRIYSERIAAGLADASARPEVIKETDATAHVDANHAVGHVGADAGLQIATNKSLAQGAGVAVVRNSNHCGTLAYFVRRATERGVIAVAATNGPPVMVYHGGKTRAVGTNPLAIGVPRTGGTPLVLDMATSATARGRIILAGQNGKSIPEGWAVDAEGRSTVDPAEALEGAVVPFAGPKGSGLAMMLDLLCGGLAAAVTGEQVGDMYEEWDRQQCVSHLFMALNPDAWVGGDAFRDHVAQFATRVSGLPPAEGFDQVLLPGELEERAAQAAAEDGVSISGNVFGDLRDLSETLGVAVPTADDPSAR